MNNAFLNTIAVAGALFLIVMCSLLLVIIARFVIDVVHATRYKRRIKNAYKAERKRHQNGDHMGQLRLKSTYYSAKDDAQVGNYYCQFCEYKHNQMVEKKLLVQARAPEALLPKVLS